MGNYHNVFISYFDYVNKNNNQTNGGRNYLSKNSYNRYKYFF